MASAVRFLLSLIWIWILHFHPLYANTIAVPGDHPTIKGAIMNASNGDTVLVSDGLYTENDIYLEGKEIVLLSQNGPETTIIDGSNSGKIFRAQNGESFNTEINGFTIQNGQSTEGAAIHVINNSFLTIRNCIIKDNLAPGIWTFGAITVGKETNNGANSVAAVHLYDCEISGNTGYYGAGIFNGPDKTVQSVYKRCVFKNNTAYHGSAIYGTGTALVEKCLFVSNITVVVPLLSIVPLLIMSALPVVVKVPLIRPSSEIAFFITMLEL